MTKNGRLYEKALEAIKELFSDMSVSQEDTRAALKSLANEIELLIEMLET